MNRTEPENKMRGEGPSDRSGSAGAAPLRSAPPNNSAAWRGVCPRYRGKGGSGGRSLTTNFGSAILNKFFINGDEIVDVPAGAA